MADIVGAAAASRAPGGERHPWKEAVVKWAEDASRDLRPATLDRYLVSLRQVRGTLDELAVEEITLRTIAQLARRSGATNATRRRDLTAVSAVLRWCVAQGWRDDNPARNWDRSIIRERRDPIVLPERAAVDAVVARAPGNLARMIRFAQYTGLRQEECSALEWSQFDRGREAVHLTRTKTNRPRSVPLDERALGTLSGTPRRLDCPFVFWHQPGDRYRNVASRFAALARRVLKREQRFRFHDLRHWYAVDYLHRGGGLYDLQKILGHRSIRTTELYLDFLTPAEQTRSRNKAAQNPAQI